MYKKITAAFIIASIAASLPCAVSADGAGEENNTLSGYINAESGILLAGDGHAPVISVDSADYEGVIRAAGDLAEDLKAVTGLEATVSGADTAAVEAHIEGESAYISHVDYENGIMEIGGSSLIEGTARGYAAAYDENGALISLSATNETAQAGTSTLSFKPVSGISYKAFLWKEQDGAISMTPVTAAYTGVSDVDIIIGTIGKSAEIDALAAAGKIDISEIKGKWESFTIQEADGKTVIAGSDKRGTIYGIYDLSEKIGVSPWYWWADAEPVHSDRLYIDLPDGGYTEGEPSVKYRGIFLNDEYNLNQWSQSQGSGNMNNETYNRIFELLLRLKANYLWPAMHEYSTAFNVTENNAKNADIYGIVMGSSHCEMLLRNNVGEWDAFYNEWKAEHPDKKIKGSNSEEAYDYTDEGGVANKEMLLDYWRERVRENGAYENTYTIGMRGVHDGAWSPSAASTTEEKKALLSEIMTEQRKILAEEIGSDIEDIPQVFIPYKEIQTIYNAGLEVPDEVTLMWTDDNYGYIRQTATDEERERSGGTGIYYHVSYYGRPTSYLWLCTTQPGLMREELVKAYDTGADRIWVLNVGDLKPAETQIEYFTKLARNVDQMRDADIREVLADNAKRDMNLNDEQAAEYADIQVEFYRLANSRRPEFEKKDVLSLTANGDEAAKYIDELSALTERSEKLYSELKETKKYTFFEMQLYPLRSVKNIAVSYIQSDRADMYAEQGRGAAQNKYAAEAEAAAAQIEADTNQYNTMLGGKWNKIMNLTPAKLQSTGGNVAIRTSASTVSALDYTEMGVDVQGDDESMSFSRFDTEYKYIDIFNRGYGSFDWRIEADKDYIIFNSESGTVTDDYRLYAGVDWERAPEGSSEAEITITQLLGSTPVATKTIKAKLSNPTVELDEKTYAETNGVVSIEAEHYSASVANGEYEWKAEKDLGRSGDSVKIYPNFSDSVSSPGKSTSAYLEYNVYFEGSGEYIVDAYRMPTLNELGTMRFAIGIDDSTPQLYKGNNKYYNNSAGTDAWGKGVLANSERIQGSITVSEPGLHTIRLYNSDPGIVVDKIVISKNGQDDSYFGAPESYNSTYNCDAPVMPEAEQPSSGTGTISKLFEPEAVVSECTPESVTIVKLSDVSSAYVITASYNNDGTLSEADAAAVDLSSVDVNEAVSVSISTDTSKPYAVIVADSAQSMQPIAPIYESGSIKSDGGTASIKADLSDYIGDKGIIVISDEEISEGMDPSSIRYVRYENITPYSFKEIPFGAESGVYSVRIGVNGSTIDEQMNTEVNIAPDRENYSEIVEEWDFSNGASGSNGNVFDVSDDALTGGGMLLWSSTGSAAAEFSNPVVASQGQKLSVEFDITFGKQDKKYMDYTISDSAGNALISSHICAYISGNSTITVGGENIIDDYDALNSAMSKSSTGYAGNKPTHFKNEFDFQTQRVYITISTEGGGSVTYSGRMQQGVSGDISRIDLSCSHGYAERACLIDNVSVSRVSGAQYAMSFVPVNSESMEAIDGADIRVYDGVYGTEITAEPDGTYMLCEGVYRVTAEADGYVSYENTVDVAPWIESKEVAIEMTALSGLEEAELVISYESSDGVKLKEDEVITGLYAGYSHDIDEKYFEDIKTTEDGTVSVYKCITEKSEVSPVQLEAGTNTVTLVFELKGSYLYYEDFGTYTPDEWEWTSPTGTYPAAVSEGDDKYLKFTSNGGTIGTYTSIAPIEGSGKTYTVSADVKFAPTGTAGNSQFAISGSSPSFDSNNVDWGVINKNTGRKAGHILVFEYNAGAELLFNGETLPGTFANTWLHMEAVVDFAAGTVMAVIENEAGESREINTPFYSAESGAPEDIGTIYMRAAKTNGTVSIDNITILTAE